MWLRVTSRMDTKVTCLKVIGLHAQNIIITIWGSIVNLIGGTYYDYSMCTRITTSIFNKTFIRAPKLWWKCITSFSCYQLFHLNNSHWHCFTRILLIFQGQSAYWQASIRHHSSTLHDIFLRYRTWSLNWIMLCTWLQLGFGFANHLFISIKNWVSRESRSKK
jgi:hypothetical protein